MDIQTAGRTIQLILAPVVMVTACGLLLNGMLSHYSAINDRLRALARERIDLALVSPAEGQVPVARERLAEIDHQVPSLIHRHRQVHDAIVLTNGAVVILIVSMFVIAGAALDHSDALGTLALFVFLAGTAVLMAGVVFMVVAVRRSDASVAYESRRVLDLPVTWDDTEAPR
jgi:hypothetical protein